MNLIQDNLKLMEGSDLNLRDEELQGGEDWHDARRGRFTSSRYADMMKQGRGKDERFGNMCLTYVYEVLAGILTQSAHMVGSQAIDWGHEYEFEAIQRYEKEQGVKVSPAPFIPYGEFAGGSPDGLVGKDGLIEVKCPFNPANHTKVLITKEIPEKYWFQVQGNIMATDRDWCDFVSYDPRVQDESLQIVVIRAMRCDDAIKAIDDRIKEVRTLLKQEAKKLNIEIDELD